MTSTYNKEELFNYLDKEVFGENNIVTYKVLSLKFELPLKLSQIVLNEFYKTKAEDVEEAENIKRLNIWYYLVGEIESSEDSEIKIQLALGEDELNEKCKVYTNIHNIFAYALGPRTDGEKNLNNLVMPNYKFFSLSNTANVLKLGGRYIQGASLKQFEDKEAEEREKAEAKAIKQASKPPTPAIDTKPSVPVKIEAKPVAKRSIKKATKPQPKKSKIKEPTPSQFFNSISAHDKEKIITDSGSDKSQLDSGDELFQNKRRRPPVVIASDEEEDKAPLEAVDTKDNNQKSDQDLDELKTQSKVQNKTAKRPKYDDYDSELEYFDTETETEKPEKPIEVKQEEKKQVITKSVPEPQAQSKPKPSLTNNGRASLKKQKTDEAKKGGSSKDSKQTSLLNFFQKK